ncbi:copine domain protein atypical [Anaeramoeba ignava]|uniref:Copine domain protein atypical n=1 Tax=Anaeramoeba ignava TaxID=1746090 RepID=A0A9Q0RDW9_ANAIG|nr:copine domain protein atypical [Anaeramoeba ignava]
MNPIIEITGYIEPVEDKIKVKENLVCFLINSHEDKWIEMNKTALKDKSGELKLEEPFKIPFVFSISQIFHLMIVQEIPHSDEQELIGFSVINIAEILMSEEKKLKKDVVLNKEKIAVFNLQATQLPPKGLNEPVQIVIPAHPSEDKQIENKHYYFKTVQKKVKVVKGLRIKAKGEKLDKKDRFGLSDPYLKLYFKDSNGQFQMKYETEVIKKTLDPDWKEFILNGGVDDFKVDIRVEVYDWNKVGKHDLIGIFETRFRKILDSKTKFELIEPKIQKKKKGYQNSGLITFEHVKKVHDEVMEDAQEKAFFPPLIPYVENATIFDYVWSGLVIKPVIGIDLSNVKAKQFHKKIFKENKNGFQFLLHQFISIIHHYAKSTISTYQISDKVKPLAESLEMKPDEIIEKYNKNIEDSSKGEGKTKVSAIIQNTIKYLNDLLDRNTYSIILILLEKEIDDFDETVKVLTEAGNYPISVIFVKIGAPFQKKITQKTCGENLKRVCFSSFSLLWEKMSLNEEISKQITGIIGKPINKEASPTPKILEEVPDQIISFMKTFRND